MKILGALIRCPDPFFLSGRALQTLMPSNPCRIHRDSIPLPRLLKQDPGSLPNHSPGRSPPSRKLLTPARKSSPPGLSPSIYLAISTCIVTPEHTATPPIAWRSLFPFPPLAAKVPSTVSSSSSPRAGASWLHAPLSSTPAVTELSCRCRQILWLHHCPTLLRCCNAPTIPFIAPLSAAPKVAF